MKTLKKFLLIPLFAIVCTFARIDSAAAVDYPFSVTTSSISSGGIFYFSLSAQGTFYVDCGTGGTLGSDNSTARGMISGGTINKTDTTKYTFKCTYSSAGTKTIRFGGTATQYNTSTSTAAIGFNASTASAELITSISGDLSVVFPYISATDGYYPRFYQTFYGCTGITSIPETLFAHITVGATHMFGLTFCGCTGLTSIPEKLFSFGGNNVSGQEDMFSSTFNGCTGLTSLPANLFSRIISIAKGMFYYTFYNCTGLTGYIPPSMFSGLIASASQSTTNMMTQIFGNTGSLATSCPSGTTQYTTRYENYWNNHVSCAAPITCSSGYYLPARSEVCTTCPSGQTCYGGTFTFNLAKDQGLPIALTWYDGNSTISGPTSCAVGGVFLPPTPPARTGYVFNGWKIKETLIPAGKCGIDALDTSISSSIPEAYKNDSTGTNGTYSENAENYGITTDNTWAVQFSYGTVWGKANCNDNSGSRGNVAQITPKSKGKKCWCQVTGFTALGGAYPYGPQCTTIESSLWVYSWGTDNVNKCAYSCAGSCAADVGRTDAVRAAAFGAVGQ